MSLIIFYSFGKKIICSLWFIVHPNSRVHELKTYILEMTYLWLEIFWRELLRLHTSPHLVTHLNAAVPAFYD